jgi:hypothetical protein
MKLIPKISLLALLLANGSPAFAQSNSVAGDPDHTKFSQFISDRNIFDPNRYPHGTTTVRHRPRPPHSAAAPAFTLVGVMTYEKGLFAFFSGSSSELKKILAVDGEVAGYTVTEITLTGVTLRGADKKEIALKIGDQMRQDNNGWQLVELGDAPAGSGAAETASSANNGGSAAADSAPVAPSASVGNNDVLKRLMELRQKETK